MIISLFLLCFIMTNHLGFAEITEWQFEEWVDINGYYIESFDIFEYIPSEYEVIDGVLFKNAYLFKFPGQKDALNYRIPDGTVGIEENAFIYKEGRVVFNSIFLPESCIDIGFDSNYVCSEKIGPLWYIASNYIVDNQNPQFSSKDGVLYSKDGTILLIYPILKNNTFFLIPEGTKKIGSYAFDSSALITVMSPETLEIIDEGAFYNSFSLRHFLFPQNLKVINDFAFEYCNSLNGLIFPSELSFIGYNAFHSCWNITEILLPNKITTLCTGAFLGCPVESIFLPPSLICIGDSIFGNDEEVCFYVLESSYAHVWCETHGLIWKSATSTIWLADC